MSFTWNAFGWINLAIDLSIIALSLLCLFLAQRRTPFDKAPAIQVLGVTTRSLILSGLLWLPAVLLIGGILGFSLGARVAWTTATVTVPLLCGWLAHRRKAYGLLVIAAALVAVKYYGEVWEPNRLEVESIEVRLPGLHERVKLVHLSDVQTDAFGPLQQKVQEAANAFDPDLVIFTGDLINDPKLAGAAGRYLKGFHHRAGKFFVSGDVDGGYDLQGVLASGGFTHLDGTSQGVWLGKNSLIFAGVSVAHTWDHPLLTRLAADLDFADARILLSHRPDALLAAGEGTFDLMMSGHTHGGQICLPFLGPIVTLTRVSREIAAGGLHRVGKLQILLSRGLGWEGHIAPRVRLFCRPQLFLVELTPSAVGRSSTVSQPDMRSAERHYLLGVRFFQRGQYDKARHEWKISRAFDRDNSNAKTGLQRIYKLSHPTSDDDFDPANLGCQ